MLKANVTEINYRSEKEFLHQLQRVYDVAIYSLFGTLIFFIITNLISLGIQLKVVTDNVDYITRQVNHQRKEYEETVRRFVRDAFVVKKYYENGPATFEPVEASSIEEAISKYKKMRKEQSVDKTIEEINKHRTVLDKMKVVINQPEKKQFDSKFTKLVEQLNKTGQTTTEKTKNASGIIQDRKSPKKQKDFNTRAKILKTSEIERKDRSGEYVNLTQDSIRDQKSQMMTEKTQPSVVKTPNSGIAETLCQQRKSVPSLSRFSPISRKSPTLSSKVSDKISRILEVDKTQSSPHRRSQRSIRQVTSSLLTGSKSDAMMMKLLKPSKIIQSKSMSSQKSLTNSSGRESSNIEDTLTSMNSITKSAIKQNMRPISTRTELSDQSTE